MPEIAPAAPLLPSAPAQVVAAANIASTVPATPVGGEHSAADFLGQLKAALKSLAGAITVTQPAPAAATPEVPAHTAKSDDKTPDEVTEVLATLGFVLAPTPQPTTPVEASDTAPARAPKVAPPVAPLTASSATIPPAPATPKTPETVHSIATPATPVESPAQRPITTTTTTSTTATSPTPAVAKQVDAQQQAAATTATDTTATAIDTTATAITAPHTVPAPQTAPQVSPVATATTTIQSHLQNTGGQFQQGSDSGDPQTHHGKTTSGVSTEADSGAPKTAAPDQTFAATTAAASTATNATPQPTSVHPGEVVSQIAHQADLYRLPGNKGVRIQLHPDDLGGVQVTVRYAAGGGLELHINVEHASTGALVQAGWTELRDALATQGISPDRLVMSVTGPSSTGSSQLDLSSNGGSSYRSDQGLAGFGGDQPGQQRQGTGAQAEDGRTSRRWGTFAEPSTAVDETPRAVASSRIDYRV